MLTESLNRESREFHDPAGSRRLRFQERPAAPDLGECVIDRDDAALEVDILPAQRQDLPATQATTQSDDVKCVESIVLNGGKKSLGLLNREMLDDLSRHPRGFH
jgi:hypothetical protein